MPPLPSRLARPLRIAGSSDGDRVTNLELFFDLVYAFAFTQVTALVTHGRLPGTLIDGFIVLSLLWFSWCAFSWLANQARADAGILRVAVIVAMVAVFIACLAVPDAFHDTAGTLDAAGVVVACYAVVRVTHIAGYLLAARRDEGLRRQIVSALLASVIPTLSLLAAGAAVGQPAQRWVWLVAVLYDFGAIFLSANAGQGWRIRSAAHFAERYSLIVILALGESIVAIATGLGSAHLTWRVALGAVLSILVAVGLYAAYFDRLLGQFEEVMEHADARTRAKLGQDVFTYLHFPIIVGVIVSAFGVERAMGHLGADRLGEAGGWALAAGAAIYLAGTIASAFRCCGELSVLRLGALATLIALGQPLALLPPLAGIGVVAAVLLALAVADAPGSALRGG